MGYFGARHIVKIMKSLIQRELENFYVAETKRKDEKIAQAVQNYKGITIWIKANKQTKMQESGQY